MSKSQLTLDETESIKWYTSDSNNSQHLNQSLRKNKDLDEEELYNYNILLRALEKFRIGKNYKVYRGIQAVKESDATDSFNIPYKSFLSTSLSKSVAEDDFSGTKCCLFSIILPKGTSALELGNLSNVPSEKEILVRPGGTLLLLDKGLTDNGVQSYDLSYSYYPEKVKEFEEQFDEDIRDEVLIVINKLYMTFGDTYDIYTKNALYQMMEDYFYKNIKNDNLSLEFTDYIFEKVLERFSINNL